MPALKDSSVESRSAAGVRHFRSFTKETLTSTRDLWRFCASGLVLVRGMQQKSSHRERERDTERIRIHVWSGSVTSGRDRVGSGRDNDRV